jgi:hypothetical protein
MVCFVFKGGEGGEIREELIEFREGRLTYKNRERATWVPIQRTNLWVGCSNFVANQKIKNQPSFCIQGVGVLVGEAWGKFASTSK